VDSPYWAELWAQPASQISRFPVSRGQGAGWRLMIPSVKIDGGRASDPITWSGLPDMLGVAVNFPFQ
jgi:hypothetical protein